MNIRILQYVVVPIVFFSMVVTLVLGHVGYYIYHKFGTLLSALFIALTLMQCGEPSTQSSWSPSMGIGIFGFGIISIALITAIGLIRSTITAIKDRTKSID